MGETITSKVELRPFTKPTLRLCRDGWRFKWDMRFVEADWTLGGSIYYVGPYATASEAFRATAFNRRHG